MMNERPGLLYLILHSAFIILHFYERNMAWESLVILFEDTDFVAVNKPARLATIPGRAERDSVLEQIGRQISLPSSGSVDPRIRVVHRLDKETSGVLLFAKNSAAQRFVSEQFQNNTTEKEYLALISGRPVESTGRIEADLAPHPSNNLRMAVVKHGGRPAVTEWKIEGKFRDYTLLRVFPKTGKTHQIRVHLKHIGLPLAIDHLYNAPAPGKPAGIFLSHFKRDYRPNAGQQERPLIDRLTLHAEKLRFTHPNGQKIEIIAPPPKDFRATINMLSRHSGR
jgi:23S rRNA pseudouridine955/2504/2580 synthase/23S rRNA pseudouridine1911/1915/1917 synthase